MAGRKGGGGGGGEAAVVIITSRPPAPRHGGRGRREDFRARGSCGWLTIL